MNPEDQNSLKPETKSTEQEATLRMLEAQLELMREKNRRLEPKPTSRPTTVLMLIILIVLLIGASFLLDFMKDYYLAHKSKSKSIPVQFKNP